MDMRSLAFSGFLVLTFAVPGCYGSSISPLICSNSGSTTSVSNTSLNANSCTDYSYSFVQGANNWFYGYYQAPNTTPGGFTPMTKFTDPTTGDSWWAVNFNSYWTSEDAFGAHPNSPATDYHIAPNCNASGANANCGPGGADPNYHPPEQWAVRRYEVPTGFAGGDVKISLSADKDPRTDTPLGDGVINEIVLYHGGVATTLGTLPLTYNQTSVATITLNNVFVQAGDIIDFVLAPEASDYGDGTFTLDTIQSVPTQVPEPATIFMAGAALLGLGLARRRKSRL